MDDRTDVDDSGRDATPQGGGVDKTEGATTELPTSRPTGPTHIGPYRILKELGRGGQGAVYAAEDPRLKRRVAVKILAGFDGASEETLARFRREAEAAARVDHPGVCAVYETGMWTDPYGAQAPYIVMRHVSGTPLSSRIRERREAAAGKATGCVALPEIDTGLVHKQGATSVLAAEGRKPTRDDVLKVVRLVELAARALHAAHEQGVVHRDVKPQNIMVAADGQPVILDFGLARDDASVDDVTRTGDFFGTPAYMSPEQLHANRVRVDRRADVWALGVTLYECLTLRRPFEHPTPAGLHYAIAFREPEDPRRLNRAVPRDLAVVVETALEKDRERRYATAQALADDLLRVQRYEPVAARPVRPWTRVARLCARNKALAASTLALMLSLTVGLVAAWRLNRDLRASAVDVERLSHLPRLRSLLEEERRLWPLAPERVPEFAAWVEEADRLVATLPFHKEQLARLARSGASAAEPPAGSLPSWVAVATRDPLAWEKELVAELERLAGDDPATSRRAAVKARLARAREIRARTLEAEAEAWRGTVMEIADPVASPLYKGLRITPQLGLIPLGRDPDSHLHEFLHWATHAPGAPAPSRDARTGRLALKEETGVVFVLVPPGEFDLGGGADEAGSRVDADVGEPTRVFTPAFFVAKHELTQGQWIRCDAPNPSLHPPGFVHHPHRVTYDLTYPVENVDWFASRATLTRVGLRLPTEIEWEYAARGGTDGLRWCGRGPASLEGCANVRDRSFTIADGESEPWTDGFVETCPADAFRPNPFGLHNVYGNVAEWCEDLYLPGADAAQAAAFDRLDPTVNRAFRGGAFHLRAADVSSCVRLFLLPRAAVKHLGLRPVRSVDP